MATIETYQTATGATRYMVRYRTPQHTQTKKRGFTTKRDAKEFANTVEVEKLTGNYVAPSLGQVTVAELVPGWLARQAHHKASWSARLESVWRVHVEPTWGRRRIADIRRTEVQTWVAAVEAVGVVSGSRAYRAGGHLGRCRERPPSCHQSRPRCQAAPQD